MTTVEVASIVTEDGDNAYVVQEEEESAQVFAETGIRVEADDDDQVVYQQQEGDQVVYQQMDTDQGQDLVSLAMESSKVLPETTIQETPQETTDYDDDDEPNEIECQLIQKNVYISGEVQTIDFIMCNKCPRLFRTENLLWNHIKVKHKRRSMKSFSSPAGDRRYSAPVPRVSGGLELGEVVDEKPVASSPVISRTSPAKTETKQDVFVVGLEKTGSRLGRPPNTPNSTNRKTPRRSYTDNSGPFKCPGCEGVTFGNRRSLEMHMKRLHKAGIVDCDECGRKVLDLKRHKEILHKRFKIFDCPHCDDKFCTQDDMERHLAKVEANNEVYDKKKEVTEKPQPLNEANADNKSEETPKSPVILADNSAMKANEKAEATKVVKQLESKVLSCSECGMKTHSRMTYIQHVLNGCIMDIGDEENKNKYTRTGARRGRPPGSASKKQKVEV